MSPFNTHFSYMKQPLANSVLDGADDDYGDENASHISSDFGARKKVLIFSYSPVTLWHLALVILA